MSRKRLSSDEMQKLMDGVSTDIINSLHYRKVLKLIENEMPNYETIFGQSNIFWSHALNGMATTSITCLCRVYDKTDTALSLSSLLNKISNNKDLFSEENFRARLQDNPHIESLVRNFKGLQKADLESHKKLVSDSDDLVHKLILWRNNLYAHRSSKTTLLSFKNMLGKELTWDEFDELSNRALNIFNCYQNLFKAASWSSLLIGENDFLSLLNFAKNGMDQLPCDS